LIDEDRSLADLLSHNDFHTIRRMSSVEAREWFDLGDDPNESALTELVDEPVRRTRARQVRRGRCCCSTRRSVSVTAPPAPSSISSSGLTSRCRACCCRSPIRRGATLRPMRNPIS
jgi:hypothetical protein